jgi:hypothetical protein
MKACLPILYPCPHCSYGMTFAMWLITSRLNLVANKLSELRINARRAHSASLIETQPPSATAILGRISSTWKITARQTRDCCLRLSTWSDRISTPTFSGKLSSGKRVPFRDAEGHALPVRHGVVRVESSGKCTSRPICGVSLFWSAAQKAKSIGCHVGIWEGAATCGGDAAGGAA